MRERPSTPNGTGAPNAANAATGARERSDVPTTRKTRIPRVHTPFATVIQKIAYDNKCLK